MNKVIFATLLVVFGLIFLANKCNRTVDEESNVENELVKKVEPKAPVYKSADDSMKAMEALIIDDVTPGQPGAGKSPQNAGQVTATDALNDKNNPPPDAPDVDNELHIIVGQGGGFTGAVTTHSLSSSGRYQKKSSIKEMAMKMGQKDANVTAAVFSDFNALDLEGIDFQKPGNMYYFVGYKKGEETKKIVWGSPSDPPPANVKAFYEKFYETIINQ